MTLDHVAWWLFPGYPRAALPLLMHIIGRLTAPIMWYFVAEGYHYTHDVKKYAGRLFLLALISHFAYNFCFGISFIPFRKLGVQPDQRGLVAGVGAGAAVRQQQ